MDATEDDKSPGERRHVVAQTATTCGISFIMILHHSRTPSAHQLGRQLSTLLNRRCCGEAQHGDPAQLEHEGWCPQTLRTVEATHRRSRLHVVSL